MGLPSGLQLGPYEILTPLGAGGMGEVYKARDTRLNRTVAIKVLPGHVSADSEARQRFEREAQTVASLNHPNICVLHDVGRERPRSTATADANASSESAIDFLVMEFLEGETLAERLAKGPLPPGEAVTIALQIASALDVAHRSGIVHRDLKPGNIFLMRGETRAAKLLDFGLARLAGAASSADPASTKTVNVSIAPTVSSPLTMQGTVLGTFQYMAPEQIEGHDADARADIFAFGAVLHEMFTGKRAFQEASPASTMAAILTANPPPPSSLSPVSPRIDHVVRRCLEKNPANRWQSIRDVALELQSAADPSDPLSSALSAAAIGKGHSPKPSLRTWSAAAAVVVVLMAVSAAAALYLRTPAADPAGVSFELPAGGNPYRITISPDGRTIAYNAPAEDGRPTVWIRALGSLEARIVPGIIGNPNVDWSPDSRFLLFNAPDGTLKRVEVSGGTPQTITRLREGGNQRASWSREGVIVFSNGGVLYRVPAAGGDAVQISELDRSLGETAHATPWFLPDGRRFLYTAWSNNPENRAIYVGSIDSGGSAEERVRAMATRVRLMPAESKAIYVEPGFLLFLRDQTLMARPFDADRLEFTGEPRQIADNVLYNSNSGAAAFYASDGGTIVYRRAGQQTAARSREWRWSDRAGRLSEAVGAPHGDEHVVLSHDGKQIATVAGDNWDVWIQSIERGVRTRLTTDPAIEAFPVWSPDDSRVIFMSNRGTRGREADQPADAAPVNGSPNPALERWGLYQKPASGAVPERLLRDGDPDVQVIPYDWSADGRSVVALRTVRQERPATPVTDIWVVPTDGSEPHEYLSTPFFEVHPALSPDGRWLAYASNESGAWQVVVQPFPDPSGGKWQVSSNGGVAPRWRGDGRELYYLGPDGQLVAVPIAAKGTQLDVGVPVPLFEVPLPFPAPGNINPRVPYGVTADGQRFLLSLPIEAPNEPITVVTRWWAGLQIGR